MKKFLICMLCICLVMPLSALAADKAIIGFDKAEKTDNTVVAPVYISHIPDGIAGISALTYIFTYDNSVIEFKSISDGTIAGISGYFNKPDDSVGRCIVSWFDGTDEGIKAIGADNVGKENPLFYVEFEILDTSVDYAIVNIEKAKISDVYLTSSTNENLNTISAMIPVSAQISGGETEGGDDIGGEESGDGETDDSETGDEGSSDDNTGDDNTDDDNTGNDDSSDNDNTGNDNNTGDDNTGNDDNTGSDNDDSNTGDDSDSDSDDDNSTGRNDTSSGPLKPSTDNKGNGSGNNGSGSNSGNKGGNTGSVTVGNTTGTTGTVTTVTPVPQKKASEIFSDVDDSHWAAEYAVRLSELGIISGDDKGRANLDNKITRAETAKIALLVNDIEVKSGLELNVTDSADVPGWARDYIATAVAEGIFKGSGDGSIKPVNNITRAEVVSVIISSLGIDADDASGLEFADMDESHWAAKLVAKSVELGFVNGYTDNTFKPSAPITRAEAFAIFARVADYLEK